MPTTTPTAPLKKTAPRAILAVDAPSASPADASVSVARRPRRVAASSPLKGVRIVSLALNLPGPAALMRCREMGATCLKLEPPAPAGAVTGVTGDPMSVYNPAAYQQLHEGVRIAACDLKTPRGQAALHRELARADVLLTSFRPSALRKLGLDWKALHRQHPHLSQVAIVGSPGDRAEEPGHDLTYLAGHDLVTGLDLPATLYADMGGSLMASEAVLQAVLQQRLGAARGRAASGVHREVALADAAAYLALPRAWGLTAPGQPVGGGHAGYRVYPCKDGRVAVAALEPHFAARLREAAGLADTGPAAAGMKAMSAAAAHEGIAAFLLSRTRRQLDRLAAERDIPLHTLHKEAGPRRAARP